MATACLPPSAYGCCDIVISLPGPEEHMSQDQSLAEMLRRITQDRLKLPMQNVGAYQVLSIKNAVGHIVNLQWDFARAEREMRALANHQGIDFDALLDRASANFASPKLMPFSNQLTEDELNSVIDHDDESLNG